MLDRKEYDAVREIYRDFLKESEEDMQMAYDKAKLALSNI